VFDFFSSSVISPFRKALKTNTSKMEETWRKPSLTGWTGCVCEREGKPNQFSFSNGKLFFGENGQGIKSWPFCAKVDWNDSGWRLFFFFAFLTNYQFSIWRFKWGEKTSDFSSTLPPKVVFSKTVGPGKAESQIAEEKFCPKKGFSAFGRISMGLILIWTSTRTHSLQSTCSGYGQFHHVIVRDYRTVVKFPGNSRKINSFVRI
jgi:hypothetical protein